MSNGRPMNLYLQVLFKKKNKKSYYWMNEYVISDSILFDFSKNN